MKKIVKTAGVVCVLLLSSSLALVDGCATTSGLLALLQAGVIEGASLGTAKAIVAYPAYKPDFVLAAKELTTLSTGTNVVTSASIDAVLTQAGETNAAVVALITAGLAEGDAYLAQAGAANANSIYVDVAGWLAAGINEGLAISYGKLKVKYHVR